MRTTGFGDEHLVFGPNRSVHRNEVEPQLEAVFRRLEPSIQSFIDNPTAADFEPLAIHTAAWAHAEVIRIHPFIDGNGRSSRVLMNAILVGLRLPPIPVEAVKQEYNEALNMYFRTQNLRPLEDLLLQLVGF